MRLSLRAQGAGSEVLRPGELGTNETNETNGIDRLDGINGIDGKTSTHSVTKYCRLSHNTAVASHSPLHPLRSSSCRRCLPLCRAPSNNHWQALWHGVEFHTETFEL